MRPSHKVRFWRTCRVCFRRFRITVWVVVLCLLGGFLYLNQVGLPGPFKKPLLEELRGRGLDLQFSRLRWRFYQGIVAENARFGRPDEPLSPQLTVSEVQVRVNLRALARMKPKVDSVMLRGGRLTWPFAPTNGSAAEIVVNNIQSELRFLPNDLWELDHFRAQLAGATFELAGLVTNASVVRDWPFLHGVSSTTAAPGAWDTRLRHLADTLERIHFSAPPELRLHLRGDATDLQSFGLFLAINTPGADTPWGVVSEGRFTGRLLPAGTNRTSQAHLKLEAASAQTPWASITNFLLDLQLTSAEGQTNLAHCRLAISAAEAATPWASGSNIIGAASWVHSITNPVPLSGSATLKSDLVLTRWANARQARITGRLFPLSMTAVTPDASWGWWTNLPPYGLAASLQAGEVQYSNLVATAVSCSGSWFTPRLTLTNFTASLYGGEVALHGDVEIASREANIGLESSVDPHRISTILPPQAQRWLEEVSWVKPPQVKGQFSLILPDWTNRQPDWVTEIKPSLNLRGEVGFKDSLSYKGVTLSTAHSHIIYSNRSLHLPDLTVTRPEGRFTAVHDANQATEDFYWRIASSIDPQILRPLLGSGADEAFGLFKLTEPPRVEAEIWGRSREPKRTGFRGHVALTNFTFREESISFVQTSLQFSNKILQCFAPEVQHGAERATADGVTADFNTQFAYLTNGVSNADPMFIARVIGTNVVRAIQPYQFSNPPNARVYGTIPLHGDEGADLHFDLDGGPFHWWKFNLPHIASHVHWGGLHATLTNLQADFYGGKLAGAAAFDFPPGQGTEFRFAAIFTNTFLKPLTADLFGGTNQPEGQVSGTLTVTRGSTDSWRTVFGYGEATLHDGLLWDFPLFGVFSPVLNGIAPGLGNSRATAGTCSFIVTNGVIWSRDLDLRCTGMRLKYHGSVDLESRVDARVEADLLRDMWMVGPIVSTMFWPVTKMFEYRVTGTLAEPKADPVFIVPKLVLFPFHPLRSLKGLFQEDSNPVFSPLPAEK